MRKLYFLLVITIFAGQLGFAQGFTVQNFSADIHISSEGYFDVIENYDIDFTESKHGIYRDIVTKFDFTDADGKVSKREIFISNIEIPGEKFNTNIFLGRQIGDNLNIRIGDKNILVNGNKHYEIRYRVKNGLFFTDDLAQLYWNIKPSHWQADFNKINFTINTPEGTSLSSENCFVYSGNTDNTEPSTEFDYEYSGNTFSGNSKADFQSSPGQNVTVLVKLPRPLIREAGFTIIFWKRYGWLVILGLVLLGLFLFIRNKLLSNKVIAVTSYYPPVGIDPAIAGVLIDNTTDFNDITCLLPYWATKGIIRIEEVLKTNGLVNRELKLIKLKDLPGDSADYEFCLFNKIFNGKKEVLVNSILGGIRESWWMLSSKADRYYTQKKSNLNVKKMIVLGFSWVWAFSSILILPILFFLIFGLEPYILIPMIPVMIINFIFFFLVLPIGYALIANKMRSKNEKGKSIMPELLGFYQFIKIAEVNRIKELLKHDPYYFEKTMPYAMAFNFLKEWTTKFDGLILHSPNWYTSSSGRSFSMNNFASSFSSSMAVASTSMLTSSSSSSSSRSSSSFRSGGGGYSGRGAGGGGGGSW